MLCSIALAGVLHIWLLIDLAKQNAISHVLSLLVLRSLQNLGLTKFSGSCARFSAVPELKVTSLRLIISAVPKLKVTAPRLTSLLRLKLKVYCAKR